MIISFCLVYEKRSCRRELIGLVSAPPTVDVEDLDVEATTEVWALDIILMHQDLGPDTGEACTGWLALLFTYNF